MTTHDGKTVCIKVTRPETHGDNSCIYRFSGFDLEAEFDGAEMGESITLTIIAMTEQEIDDLPEFEGW